MVLSAKIQHLFLIWHILPEKNCYTPYFSPTVGIVHSQAGNILFPSWEYLLHNQRKESVPNKGRLLFNKRWLLLDKCRLFDDNRIILEKGRESYRKNTYLCSRKKRRKHA